MLTLRATCCWVIAGTVGLGCGLVPRIGQAHGAPARATAATATTAADGTAGQGTPGTPGTIVLAPTAVPLGQGKLRWRVSDIALHELDYGVSRRLQAGLKLLLPVVYVGAFPSLTATTRLTERLYGGLQLLGGVFWPYTEVEALESFFTGRFVLYGAGAMLTHVGDRLVLNCGVPLFGVRYGQKEFRYRYEGYAPIKLSRTYFDDHFFAVPNVGVIWQVARRLRLKAEVHVPLGTFDDSGRLWIFAYGAELALSGALLELTFVLPAYDGAEDLLRYLPLGVPVISTTFNW